jgi:hypothetical protein
MCPDVHRYVGVSGTLVLGFVQQGRSQRSRREGLVEDRRDPRDPTT